MKITITGTNSGIGYELCQQLKDHKIIALNRQQLDLSNINNVKDYQFEFCDILINCAGTDRGGKIVFTEHSITDIIEILTVNLLSPVILSHKAINANPNCKIVNITSTNNNRYYANDLAYSLSKMGLANFTNMLKIDLPDAQTLEVRLGLTKTSFNSSRYKDCPERSFDIYQLPHLKAKTVAEKIISAMFDHSLKFIEIAP